jgi:glycosyltransferase involved in cell wall biosynthesis
MVNNTKMQSKLSDKTLVTVGIPYYAKTELNHFRLAIDSVLEQSYKPDEIHLIQDGPVSEQLRNLVNQYEKKHNIIKKITIAENMGLAYALNISILNSNSKYYARMDSDDICHPERLKKQIDYMETHPKIDILGSWVSEFYDDNIFVNSLNYEDANENSFIVKTPENIEDIRRKFHYRNPLCHVTIIYRRNVFAKVGLYNANYRRTQDLELWSRVLKKDVGIANLQQSLVYVRAKDFAEKRSDFASIIRQLKVRYKYNTLSPKYNLLKIASIIFRLLPYKLRKWGYNNLR